jgi:hypothetical protein
VNRRWSEVSDKPPSSLRSSGGNESGKVVSLVESESKYQEDVGGVFLEVCSTHKALHDSPGYSLRILVNDMCCRGNNQLTNHGYSVHRQR